MERHTSRIRQCVNFAESTETIRSTHYRTGFAAFLGPSLAPAVVTARTAHAGPGGCVPACEPTDLASREPKSFSGADGLELTVDNGLDAAFSHDIFPRNSSCFTRKRQLWVRRALRRHNSSLVARGSRHERNTHGDSRISFGSTLLLQTTHGSREGN